MHRMLRLHLAIALLRTAHRLHDAADQMIHATEYREPGVHRSELVMLALMVGIGVSGVWIGIAVAAARQAGPH